ncbi:MAG: response regulator [Clostridia bacterium]|nr:response regulator [Clostridia bacterium]
MKNDVDGAKTPKKRLSQQELKLQLEKEQLANASKTEFLNRMSHDIRTPMNAIMGLNELAQVANKDPIVADYLKKMQASSRFLLGLINDILDMSKIESGQFELHYEPHTLDEFKASLDTVIRPLMEEKHIDFKVEMNCGFNYILSDKLRYNQIFFNILSNAAKFTRDGGEVVLRTEGIGKKDGKTGIRYHVKDNGIGMSEEFIPHIFDAFSQEMRADETGCQGTGLGMPIVRQIVEAMGGSISVESKINEGTEFIVDLWVEEIAKPATSKTDGKTVQLKDRKILLADDNKMNVLIAKKLLETRGCTVYVAGDGRDALTQFENSADDYFDAILMDVRMPVMDGLAATKAIRALSRPDAKTVPILALTANAYDEDKKASLDAGMTAHLAKPIEPQTLYETLEAQIKNT